VVRLVKKNFIGNIEHWPPFNPGGCQNAYFVHHIRMMLP
jgi:hypothetical protein